MSGPEVHHLFHHPIADHSFSADRSTLAVARENNVELYQRSGNKFILKDELKGHDKTVTGVDIAPGSGMIVTSSQGETDLNLIDTNVIWMLTLSSTKKIVMPTSGNPVLRAGLRHSSCSASTALPHSSAGPLRRRNSQLGRAPVLSQCATLKRRMTGGFPNT